MSARRGWITYQEHCQPKTPPSQAQSSRENTATQSSELAHTDNQTPDPWSQPERERPANMCYTGWS
ncbi:hypothetical protein DPV78_002041 [Talaromyces pinophilus]|nr:hypothetical protein DPV78_002041 [Talaromyces pinophilus]